MMNNTKTALKEFYQQVGEKYPEEDQVYHTLRGMLRKQFILRHLEKFHGSLLDIGCNQGMYLRAYKNGSRFGIDLSQSVLKKAKSRLDNQTVIHFAVGDSENLFFFKPNSFDHVLCSEVLEHCLHPQKVFDSIAHVLKPGGIALLTTPNYTRHRPEWIDLGALKDYNIHSDCEQGYFHTAYKPEELGAFARVAGLQVRELGTLEKEVKYAAKIPAAFLLLNRLLNRKLIHSQKFSEWNEHFFDKFQLAVYHLSRLIFLNHILVKIISNGVRSYIIMEK